MLQTDPGEIDLGIVFGESNDAIPLFVCQPDQPPTLRSHIPAGVRLGRSLHGRSDLFVRPAHAGEIQDTANAGFVIRFEFLVGHPEEVAQVQFLGIERMTRRN